MDGYTWTDQGIAIPHGEPGSIDETAAITPYVVPHEGQYVLFYTALGALGPYPGITYATAQTPDGPWTKSDKPLGVAIKIAPTFRSKWVAIWIPKMSLSFFVKNPSNENKTLPTDSARRVPINYKTTGKL